MANDWHLIQIRIGQRLKNQIRSLSEKYGYSYADIMRGSLELGVRITEKLFESQDIIVKEYLSLLKNQSRKRNPTIKQPESLLKTGSSNEFKMISK
jgi:hypothetical protein